MCPFTIYHGLIYRHAKEKDYKKNSKTISHRLVFGLSSLVFFQLFEYQLKIWCKYLGTFKHTVQYLYKINYLPKFQK